MPSHSKKMPKAMGGMMMKKMKAVKRAKKGAAMEEMQKGGKVVKKVMIPAPKGHHWMNEGGRFYLMAHEGEFKPHKGAMLKAPFEIRKAHSASYKKAMYGGKMIPKKDK